ncbi:MAG: alpha amylase C-terminal domain-containing protein, partial [Verrucomicrobiota bacterium]|nr:alpha amylase C-terminal domain-containing protein [Verrucomicrobiota bacterium]
CFCNNQVTWLHNSDENDLVTFLRSDDRDGFVVVINFSNRPVAGRVELADGGEYKPVPIAGLADSAGGELPQFRLNGFEWRIYHVRMTK